MRRSVAILGLVAVAAPLGSFVPARADHELLHACGVQQAVARFPDGFTTPHEPLDDATCGYPIGGFGGALDDDAEWGVDTSGPFADHDPVIFVHGNVVDHADWYPVRDAFVAAGWDPADLWALSYNGLGNESGSAGGTPNPRRDAEHQGADGDGLPRNTNNEANVDDLASFIDAVLEFTGADRFSLAGHSLGVTLARRTLETRSDLAGRLVAFVAIAGANHGTSLCPPGTGGVLHSCDELDAGSAWLDALNAEPDELGEAAVMTVYDGTGAADVAFIGPTYADSPRLGDITERALDCTYPGRGHNDLRLSAGIVAGYRAFIEAAETGTRLTACPPDPLNLR